MDYYTPKQNPDEGPEILMIALIVITLIIMTYIFLI